MNIANALKRLAEKILKVYEAGKKAGKALYESAFQEIKNVMGGHLPDDTPTSGYAEAISTALRAEHSLGYDEGTYDGYVNGKQEGKQEGKAEGELYGRNAAWNAFWDSYQIGGGLQSHANRYAGIGWNDNTFKPKYDLLMSYNGMVRTFSYSHIEDLRGIIERQGVVLDTSRGGNMTNMCENSWITRFPILDISNQNSGYAIFVGCSLLKSIQKLKVKDDGTTPIGGNMFQGCTELEDIEEIEGVIGKNGFDVHWSTKLSKASHLNIINALSATTTGLTVTFSKTAVNNAFGIDVDDETTWGEGSEFYALRHAKDNWTFSYV